MVRAGNEGPGRRRTLRERRRRRLMAAVLLLAALGGCASTRLQRRTYLEAHPDLDPQIRSLIEAGRVREGMTLEQVEAALGPPDSRRAFDETGGRVELWTYPGVLMGRSITRTAGDLDYRVRLFFRDGSLERIEDL